jgi:hypothetical protein
MAKRKSKRRRSKFTGINVVQAAETLIQANIITQGLFNADPLAFLIGKDSTGYGRSDLAISNTTNVVRIGIGELFGTTSAGAEANWQAVRSHFDSNWGNMLMSSAITNVGFRIGKKFLAPQRRMLNRTVKQLGLGQTVKF